MGILLNTLWQAESAEGLEDGSYRLLRVSASDDSCILIKQLPHKEVQRPFVYPLSLWNKVTELERLKLLNKVEAVLDEDEIPAKWISKRDDNYSLIKGIVEDSNSLTVFANQPRNQMVNKHLEQLGIVGLRPKKIYNLLYIYWAYGSTKNALIPNYKNSGGRGKEKVITDKPLGRKHQIKVHGKLPQGKPFTKYDKENTLKLIENKKLNRHQKFRMKSVYDDFIDEFYVEELLQADLDKRPANIPTLRQFSYYVNNNLSKNERLKITHGNSYFEGNVKQVSKNSKFSLYGPGSVFQLDATVADVHIRSTKTNNLIGRPTVYCVIDVFTRLIIGIYIGTKNASWETAKTALWYVVTDKRELIEKFGVEYCAEDWPCLGMPKTIVVDRGEMTGIEPSQSLPELGVNIKITPPYRGDLKAIVERRFGIFNGEFHKIDGTTEGRNKKRDEKDPSKKAVINLQEFGKIMINEVIAHNNQIFEELLTEDFYKRDIAPTPINTWEYFVEELKQHELRYIEQEQLFAALLQNSPKFHLTREGIVVKNLAYTSDEFRKYIDSRSLKLGNTAKVKLHPEESSFIYFKFSSFEPYIRLELAQKHAQFNSASVVERRDMQQWFEGKKKEPGYLLSQSKKRLNNKSTVMSAKKRKSKGQASEKPMGIRENRSNESNIMTFDPNGSFSKTQPKPDKPASSVVRESDSFMQDIADSWDD